MPTFALQGAQCEPANRSASSSVSRADYALTAATASAEGSFEILRNKGKKSEPAVTEEGEKRQQITDGLNSMSFFGDIRYRL
jgi:hypothetical protein